MRCEHFSRSGKRCLKGSAPHRLHVYSFPKPKRESPSASMFRQSVKARANGLCEVPEAPRWIVCGTMAHHPGDHAHHVKLRAQGGSDDPTNGRYCCARAHAWIHANPRHAAEFGLIEMRTSA